MSGQYFPSDEILISIIKTGAQTLDLPAGSNIRIAGLFHRNMAPISLDLAVSGIGGMDTGSVANSSEYYIYVVEVAGALSLVASLSASTPVGFDARRRVGKIETDGTGNLTIVGADFINEIQESQIETIQAQVSVNSAGITTLQSSGGNYGADITNLQSDVSTLQTDVGSLQTDAGNLFADMSLVQTDIGNLQTDVMTNTMDISTNTGSIGTNTTNIGTLNTSVGLMQTDVSSNTGSIGTHTSQITSLNDEFSLTTGHRHDGTDARKVLATDLDGTGGNPADTLILDSVGNPTWSASSSATPQKAVLPLRWLDGLGSSPTLQVSTNGTMSAYSYYPFATGANQKLYTSFRVPESYTPGKVIRLYVLCSSGNTSTSRAYLFNMAAYKVGLGVPVTDLSNVFLSDTTVAIAPSPADALVQMDFSVTDASGQVGSAIVNPGDLIYISLERGSVVGFTEVSEAVRVMSYASQVVFNL